MASCQSQPLKQQQRSSCMLDLAAKPKPHRGDSLSPRLEQSMRASISQLFSFLFSRPSSILDRGVGHDRGLSRRLGESGFCLTPVAHATTPRSRVSAVSRPAGCYREDLEQLRVSFLDPATEAVVPTAKPRPVKDFQTKALFFWYDYFSCPQLHDSALFVDRITSRQEQTKAINSIPAYVTRCDFFLALCPVLDCRVEGKVLTPATWSSRGWCRLERVACELSPNSTWIVIRSATSIEAVGTLLSLST